jgi:membrane peptidoglycan carboxypeptidase
MTDLVMAVSQDPSPSAEVAIGNQAVMPGGWYQPAAMEEAATAAIEQHQAEEKSEAEKRREGLFAYIATLYPEDQGQFDPSRSKLLQGIQPDMGKFDQARSGALAGIQPDQGAFDSAKSGQLGGLAEPASTFDDSKSGQLAGLGAEPAPTFDDSKSGQLAGLGGAESVEAAPASASPTQILSDTGAQESPAPAAPVPDQYSEVEAKVAELRGQYQAGQINRQQLQEQLRGMMILDEAGRWWMLGVESDRWYRFDGKDWLPDEPPRKVAPASPVTETGMNQVVAPGGQTQTLPINPDSLPLPARVPVDDPGATLVNQRAIELGEHRSWEAPTQNNMGGVVAGPLPGQDPSIPPVYTGYEGPIAPTVPGMPGYDPNAAAYDPNAAAYDPNAAAYDPNAAYGQEGGDYADYSRPPAPPMDGIQPDYSAAFSGYWDRASLAKVGLRLGLFGFLAISILSLCSVFGMLAYYYSVLNKYQSSIDNMGERAAQFETTIIYDENGQAIAQFNDPNAGTRKSIPLDQISPYLIHATISTEDETFYDNAGFSLYGILRATYQNVRTGGGGGGASTITQQLARALVLDADFAAQRSVERKMEEIIVAAEISRQYSKSQILAFYLNEIYYGNQAYGIQAASEQYFGKSAADLNPAEAAFLAGLPQAPAVYDPVSNRTIALARMQDVLRLMTEANGTGCIQMEHEPYNTQPFCVSQTDITDTFLVEIATVQVTTFRPPRFDVRYPHFVNLVRQELEGIFNTQQIYAAGFRIYTTLDPTIQDAAQRAVLEEIPITPRADNGSVVAIDPRNGAVLALVGSADFFNEAIDGQVNVAFSPQQPGSTMKTFVYLGSVEGVAPGNSWYPGTVIWDVPSSFGGYTPTNYDFSVNGPMTMRSALVRSMNVPAVKGLAYITPPRLDEILARFEVRQPGDTAVEAGLPAALGATDVYLFDFTSAYGAFATGGVWHKPYSITRVEDRNGKVIYEAPASQGLQVARPEHTYLVTHILSDPTIRETASFNIPGWQTAAKTGTTNDNRDAWTIGYTPTLVVGVWVGRTDNQPMGSGVFGSNTAAPVWNKTMTAGLAGQQPIAFNRPNGIIDVQVCSDTGAIYSAETCPGGSARTEVAFIEQPPAPADQGFILTASVDSVTGLLANDNCPEFVVDRSFVNITDQTAIAWLNNNASGQAWAQARNITLPVQTPPTQSCTPGMPRPVIAISNPAPNQEVVGLTNILGTVTMPNFTSFEFRIANADINANEFSNTLGQVYTSQQPNQNGPLGTIDFTPYQAGNYILLLLVKGQNNAEASIRVPIKVSNFVPTVAPIFTPTLAPTFTPVPGTNILNPTTPPLVFPTTDPLALPTGTPDPFQPLPPTPQGN